MDQSGRPFVLGINSMASLGAGGSFVRAAAAAGLDFSELVNRIADIAWQRHMKVNQFNEETGGHRVSPRADLAHASADPAGGIRRVPAV